MSTRRRSTVANRSIASFEERRLPAAFGTPWINPRDLDISFPTDDTTVGAYGNSMREVFDQVADRVVWQEAVLRAFQSWAVHANINIGLTADRGDPFGTVGLASNDPRFGEFRIGAFPQVGVLASALPYQPVAGSWSGDVLLNTQPHWFLADWKSTSPIQVPPANELGPAVELYTVLLHEAGNSLGIADSTTRGTVMYTNYDGPRGSLTSSDIASIVKLYGARRDIYEPTRNETRRTATSITNPRGYTGAIPLSVNGSLNTVSDVDFYRFRPIAGKEKVSVRLWASGISLVKAKLEVLDSQGNKIADVKTDSVFDNNLEIEIGSLNPSRDYFIRVAANTTDQFGVGDYRLELDYRAPELRPSMNGPTHDADAEDEDSTPFLDVTVDQLFSSGLVSTEVGLNDTRGTATVLETAPGFLTGTRYEALASLGSATDRDFYRIVAPRQTGGVMNVHVTSLGNLNPNLDVAVLNSRGDRVASLVKEPGNGTISVQVLEPVANETYTIAVRSESGTADRTGNYILTTDFATESAALQEFASGSLNGTTPAYTWMETGKSQLFRFDLSANSVGNRDGVQMTIIDAFSREIVGLVGAAAGTVRTEFFWLPQGQYMVRFDAISSTSQAPGLIHFRVLADAISDDQGPTPLNPLILYPPPSTYIQPPPPPTTIYQPPATFPPVISYPLPILYPPWYTYQYQMTIPNYTFPN